MQGIWFSHISYVCETKVAVCRTGKLKTECFRNDMDEISYPGVTLACSGVWNKCRCRLLAKGSLSVVAVDKDLARPDMKVLENAYEMH